MPDETQVSYTAVTEEQLLELRSCKKEIISNPKPNNKTNGRHKETGLDLRSLDEQHGFVIFIRHHIDLIENFSIGLICSDVTEGGLILMRYNGNHGLHKNLATGKSINGFHMHLTTMDSIKQGLKAENYAETTNEYASVEEATLCLFKNANVTNWESYFPRLAQKKLV